MARSHRPKRVVIVDADNPMVEIEGDFFWREDHEAIVAAAREDSYRHGFQAGWAEAVRRTQPRPAPARMRMATLLRLRRLVIAIAVLLVALLVLGVMVSQLLR